HAHLPRGLKEGGRQRMRIPGTPDMYRAAGTPPLIRAAFPILLLLEDRKHVGEGPPLGSTFRPPVVVSLHAAHPHHPVDAAAAAKHMTEGHVERPIVQSRRRGY